MLQFFLPYIYLFSPKPRWLLARVSFYGSCSTWRAGSVVDQVILLVWRIRQNKTETIDLCQRRVDVITIIATQTPTVARLTAIVTKNTIVTTPITIVAI